MTQRLRERDEFGRYLCPDCKEFKDEEEFYKSPQSKAGISTYCKVCHIIRQKEYYHSKKVRDEVKAEREQQAKEDLEDQMWRILAGETRLGPPTEHS